MAFDFHAALERSKAEREKYAAPASVVYVCERCGAKVVFTHKLAEHLLTHDEGMVFDGERYRRCRGQLRFRVWRRMLR